MRSIALFLFVPIAVVACSAHESPTSGARGVPDAAPIDLGDAGDLDVQPPDDAGKAVSDAGYALCDGGAIAADRFVTEVVAFTPGPCAGFGAAQMPQIVEGPPVGAGEAQGGLDVVSLGTGGSIVLGFSPNAIVDGPGADFLVFENAFGRAGDPTKPNAELGEVSVSDDGTHWTVFPCTATAYPYGACAGWHPVLSSPANCVSPVDPAVAGGDPFDLATIGVTRARYVRIVDVGGQACSASPSERLTTNGFDLDAVAIVNAERP